jgi:ribosomal protein S2
MEAFVGVLTQAGVIGVVAIWLYFERERANKLQENHEAYLERMAKEKEVLLERTLKALHDTADGMRSMESTMTTVMNALGEARQTALSGPKHEKA